MIYLQVLLSGLALGGLYACIAAGFSLVWGVLNVINILHGSFIVLGGYLAFYAYTLFGIHPFVSILIAAPLFFALGYALQRAAAIFPVAKIPGKLVSALGLGSVPLTYNMGQTLVIAKRLAAGRKGR